MPCALTLIAKQRLGRRALHAHRVKVATAAQQGSPKNHHASSKHLTRLHRRTQALNLLPVCCHSPLVRVSSRLLVWMAGHAAAAVEVAEAAEDGSGCPARPAGAAGSLNLCSPPAMKQNYKAAPSEDLVVHGLEGILGPACVHIVLCLKLVGACPLFVQDDEGQEWQSRGRNPAGWQCARHATQMSQQIAGSTIERQR